MVQDVIFHRLSNMETLQ